MGSNVSGRLEDLQSDVVGLQPLTAPGKSFIDEVLQEPLPAMRLVERAAVEDAVQLLTNGRLVGFAPVFELNTVTFQLQTCREIASPASIRMFHTVTY